MKILVRFNGIWPPKICVSCGRSFTRELWDISGWWKKRKFCYECNGRKVSSNINRLRKGLISKEGKRICRSCGRQFIPLNQNHFHCGSKKQKTGCSYAWYVQQRIIKCREYRARFRHCGGWNAVVKLGVR